ncbi:MAG: hypothetical protein HKN37_08215 [Rhodothermales bacterium]|nr:hypothetical protein [Rhodothermales bacterium]
MKRLIGPVVYILGFSVFSACTTTRTTLIKEGQPIEEARDLIVTLTDGSRLDLKMAVINKENLRGVISEADSRRLPEYFATWPHGPAGLAVTDGQSTRWTEYSVTVPLSDVSEVTHRRSGGAGVLVLAAALIGLVLFAATWEPDISIGKRK